MDGIWGYYAKSNKSDRERQTLYDFTYMWNLKNKTNITKQRKKWLPEGKGVGDGKRGEGNKRYILTVIK